MTDCDLTADAPRDSRLFYRRGLAFCAMLAVAMAYRVDALTDWDSWDYAAQAVRGHSSDLLLGRWWFVAAMRVAWSIGHWLMGLTASEGFLAMQVACMLMTAGAVVAGMAWTRRLTRSATAEMLFAGLVITGPMFGIYASGVMTEGPTLLMLMVAFWAWERALDEPRRAIRWALLAGACFGVAVDMREQAVVLCAWPIVSCFADRPSRRWTLLGLAVVASAVTLGIGVLGGWAWFPWPRGYFGNWATWTKWMSHERGQFNPSLQSNVGFLAMYCAAAAPLATVLAIPAVVWAYCRGRRLFWLAVALTPYAVTLLINHDLSVNPRFAIPLAWLLCPIAAGAVAAWVGRWRRAGAAVALAAVLGIGAATVAVGWGQLQHNYFDYAASMQRSLRAMRTLPEKAVIVAGPATPVALHLNRLGEKDFKVVGSGWEWPHGRLADEIAAYQREGRPVFANLDINDWHRTPRDSGEWDELTRTAVRYEWRDAGWPMVQLVASPTTAPTR